MLEPLYFLKPTCTLEIIYLPFGRIKEALNESKKPLLTMDWQGPLDKFSESY